MLETIVIDTFSPSSTLACSMHLYISIMQLTKWTTNCDPSVQYSFLIFKLVSICKGSEQDSTWLITKTITKSTTFSHLQDYHNIQGRRFYLPPLQQHAWAKESKQVSPREVRVHKTYTTRKGALLLYAEDLALTSQEGADGKKRSMEAEDSSYFNSISDLRNAVLSYGSGTRQVRDFRDQHFAFWYHFLLYSTGLEGYIYLLNC